MKALLAVVLLATLGAVARADSIKQVAAYLKQNAAIPLRGDVGDDLAENLLAAQAANPTLDSLLLSENAVLKAITLYEFPGGPKKITDGCCPAVWAQSTIAIDPNAGGSLSPSVLNFGSDPVSTPDPEVWLLLFLGTLGSGLSALFVRRVTSDWRAQHAART